MESRGRQRSIPEQREAHIYQRCRHCPPLVLSQAEILFLAVGLILGLVSVFAIPPSAGYDEDQHLMRVWEISAWRFIPNQALGHNFPYPATLYFMARDELSISEAWDQYGPLAIDGMDYIYGPLMTRSIYSPILLLPQAIAMRYLGRALLSPSLVVFYGCRAAGLVSYLFLGWLSIRLIPFGKRILAITALTPIALFQAATINADTISNSFGFLFLSTCLFIYARQEKKWCHWLILFLSFPLIFSAKPNFFPLAVLPFILFQPSDFKPRCGYITLLLGMLIGAVVGVAWVIVSIGHYPSTQFGCGEGTDFWRQVRYVLSAPDSLARAIGVDPWLHGRYYLSSWIAAYSRPIPGMVHWLYTAALVGAFLGDSAMVHPTKRMILGLIVASCASFASTLVLLYLTCSPVASPIIQGVQGRYLTVAIAGMLLGISGVWRKKRTFDIPCWLVALLLTSSILLFLSRVTDIVSCFSCYNCFSH